MELVNIAKNNFCHDCNQKILIKGKAIENGVLLAYNYNGDMLKVFKCHDCFEQNPSLTNFNRCEVYSRVVGYIRPVRQWHVGKKQEFQERKNYEVQPKNHRKN